MARSTGSGDYSDARRRFRQIEEEYDRLVEEARLRASMPSHGVYSRSLPQTTKRERERFAKVLTDADAYRLVRDFFTRCGADLEQQAFNRTHIRQR